MQHPRRKSSLPDHLLKWILILLFTPLLPWFANSQQPTLSRQLIFKKMAQYDAKAFLEDSEGFLWIGAGSLLRYDGHSIQPFLPPQKDTTRLFIGAVNALLEDARQRIWIGANHGLFRYDRETDQITQYLTDRPDYQHLAGRVISLFEDSSRRLWVGTRRYLYVIEDPANEDYQIVQGIDLGATFQGPLGFASIVEAKDGRIIPVRYLSGAEVPAISKLYPAIRSG